MIHLLNNIIFPTIDNIYSNTLALFFCISSKYSSLNVTSCKSSISVSGFGFLLRSLPQLVVSLLYCNDLILRGVPLFVALLPLNNLFSNKFFLLTATGLSMLIFAIPNTLSIESFLLSSLLLLALSNGVEL